MNTKKTLYDFAFDMNESVGEQPKQVQAEPIVLKGDNLRPCKILDRDRFNDDFDRFFGEER